MPTDGVFDIIRAVVADHNPEEWEQPGDAWLAHPNPDESYLLVDALADAIRDALRSAGVA